MKMAASFISDKLKRKASVHKTKSWGYIAPQPALLTSAVSFHSPEPCQTQQIFGPKCPKTRSARSFTIWNKMQHTASRTHNTMRHFCPPLLSPTPHHHHPCFLMQLCTIMMALWLASIQMQNGSTVVSKQHLLFSFQPCRRAEMMIVATC